MKKFLSAFLAAVMVLTMAATSLVTVFAADAKTADAGVHEIKLPSAEHLADYGWEVTPEKWNLFFDCKTPDGTNACLIRDFA
ncbi:MAG: hypothetical protein E7625_07645, partial [Ruminococcaceae bacterium]|nr:hypothetical protein [Oscillospiraceae bacterium]